METAGEVTLEHEGRRYGATYVVRRGSVHVKTHTETRTVEQGGQDPQVIARNVLKEIVTAQKHETP
jgi:hypothetical protein